MSTTDRSTTTDPKSSAVDGESAIPTSVKQVDRIGLHPLIALMCVSALLFFANRVQLTTDGHRAYLEAVEGAFGADVDYAQLIKMYGPTPSPAGRYSPAECTGIKKVCVEGRPSCGPAKPGTGYTNR